MAKPLRQLSPRHHRAVLMRLSGETSSSIADRLGVQRRTVYLWFSDPTIQQALHDRSQQIGDAIVNKLADHTLLALDRLRDLIDTPLDRDTLTPEQKLAALRELLDRCQFTAPSTDQAAGPARRGTHV